MKDTEETRKAQELTGQELEQAAGGGLLEMKAPAEPVKDTETTARAATPRFVF